MKVALFSNFLNHHQLPFCEAMYQLTDGQFTFVATEPVPQERLSLGYHDMNKQYPFVLTTYDSAQAKEEALRLALESDVVITGSAPELYTKHRIEHGKLTFRYSERLYKRGYIFALSPKMQKAMAQRHAAYKNDPLYMLCASAYTAFDFAISGAYVGKTYKWGYFPEIKKQDMDMLFAHKREKDRVSILWAGRLIDWKHPEAAIQVARKLKKAGYDFEMNVIGTGDMDQTLRRIIPKFNLSDCVHMLGAMSPEQVREHMEASDIFLFTSDRGEGWGAVLNEAMNSGCAVVASHAIGSVPFLLKHGENGFIYRSGRTNDLYKHVTCLLRDGRLREKLGRSAYDTLAKDWNAQVAAQRLITLSEGLLRGEDTQWKEGPCSKA